MYRVNRTDGGVLDIHPVSAGGVANAAAQDAFCAGTACTILVLYDQSPFQNHMPTAPNGTQAPADAPVNATRLPTFVGGSKVYGMYFKQREGYRNNSAIGTAVGNVSESIYMVVSGENFNEYCKSKPNVFRTT